MIRGERREGREEGYSKGLKDEWQWERGEKGKEDEWEEEGLIEKFVSEYHRRSY